MQQTIPVRARCLPGHRLPDEVVDPEVQAQPGGEEHGEHDVAPGAANIPTPHDELAGLGTVEPWQYRT